MCWHRGAIAVLAPSHHVHDGALGNTSRNCRRDVPRVVQPTLGRAWPTCAAAGGLARRVAPEPSRRHSSSPSSATREDNRLAHQEARTARAAAGWTAWSPSASRGTPSSRPEDGHTTSRVVHRRDDQEQGAASPNVPEDPHLAHEHGRSRPCLHQTRSDAVGHNPVVG